MFVPLQQLHSFHGPGDPLVLWDGPHPADGQWWAWTHWVKGAARATMAVFTAALSIQCGWDLAVLRPALYESLQCVWARAGDDD